MKFRLYKAIRTKDQSRKLVLTLESQSKRGRELKDERVEGVEGDKSWG